MIILNNNLKLINSGSAYGPNAQSGSFRCVSFSNNFGPTAKQEVIDLVNAFGSVIEVDESHLHQVVLEVWSSFPYPVFEQYVKAGTNLGLEASSEESIRNLIIGTSKMIERSDLSMEQLRKILHPRVVLRKQG